MDISTVSCSCGFCNKKYAKAYDDATCDAFKPKFPLGTRVRKVKGYAFPGTVVSVFRTQKNLERYVVECDVPEVNGILHIYGPKDLEPYED